MTIEVRNLVKRFGAFAALDDVDLRVAKGELLALLGLVSLDCGQALLVFLVPLLDLYAKILDRSRVVDAGGMRLADRIGYLGEIAIHHDGAHKAHHCSRTPR